MAIPGSNPPTGKGSYYFQVIMVVVYLGLGLLLLFSGPIDFVPEDKRKWLGGIFLAYGSFRAIMVWQKGKRLNSNDRQSH